MEIVAIAVSWFILVYGDMQGFYGGGHRELPPIQSYLMLIFSKAAYALANTYILLICLSEKKLGWYKPSRYIK